MIQTKPKMSKTAVVVPAFNEALHIRSVIQSIKAAGYYMVVINDGSTDDTAKIIEESGVDSINLSKNLGKGTALRTGMAFLFEKNFDGIITVDADGQHSINEIPTLEDAALKAKLDLALGVRTAQFKEMRPIREFANKLTASVVGLITRKNITDSQTGFRYYSRNLYEAVGFPGTGFEAETAIIIRAARAGLNIGEVPISSQLIDGSNHSHYRTILDSVRIAKVIFIETLSKTRF